MKQGQFDQAPGYYKGSDDRRSIPAEPPSEPTTCSSVMHLNSRQGDVADIDLCYRLPLDYAMALGPTVRMKVPFSL